MHWNLDIPLDLTLPPPEQFLPNIPRKIYPRPPPSLARANQPPSLPRKLPYRKLHETLPRTFLPKKRKTSPLVTSLHSPQIRQTLPPLHPNIRPGHLNVTAHGLLQRRRDQPPLNYSSWPSIFRQPYFSRHPPKQRPSFSRHGPRSSSVWVLYVALSSLTLPLRQRIRPFTTNTTFYPRVSPGRGFGVVFAGFGLLLSISMCPAIE